MARSYDGGSRRLTCAWACWFGAAWLVATGCGSSDSASFKSFEDGGSIYDPAGSGGNASNGGIYSTYSGGSTGTSTTAPPEVEVVVDFETPQSSENYVYATNPDQDSVAVISASSLAIEVVETGDEPRYLRTIPFKDAAMLVDVLSSDLAYIETANGQSAVTYFKNLPSANAIQVAPDGKHAVAYYDVDLMKQGQFETLQDVTVMTFEATGPIATRMTTGFKARQVTFAGDATGSPAAYLVTEEGISILDFAAIDATKKSAIAQPVPVFTALEPKGADISVTPDGSYAIGRIAGTSKLRLVALATGKPLTLDLASVFPATTVVNNATGGAGTGGAGAAGAAAGASGAMAGDAGAGGGAATGGAATGGAATGGAAATVQTSTVEITDLDVAPNGKFALAVARDRGTLLRVPIPEGFSDPQTISKLAVEGVIVGSAAISPNGRWAVLYTTAVTSERRIVIVDLVGELAPRVVDLTKIIKGVAFSSSGDQAYVAHTRADVQTTGAVLTTDQIIDRAFGYTLVDLPKAFRKLQITEADPKLSVTTPAMPYVFLTFADDKKTVQRIDMDSLQVDSLELGSVPIALGVVPAARRAFVSQNYAEGRLTFIDWATLETKTVTGYELNSKIRE